MWVNIPCFNGVTRCYTTVVKTVQIHVVYGYIVCEGYSYPALRVTIDHYYGRSKYTTYINEWMTRQLLVNVKYYNYYNVSLTIGYLVCIFV